MKLILIYIVSLFFLLSFITSCAKYPSEEVKNAFEAINKAQNDQNAVFYAKSTLAKAQDAFGRLNVETKTKHYSQIRALSAETIFLAEKAIREGNELKRKEEFDRNREENVKREATLSNISSFSRNIMLTNPRMNGTDIIKLQERLLELGYTGVGDADGYYGPKTADIIYFIKAIYRFVEDYLFQEDMQNPNYIVDRQLWEIIFSSENERELIMISSTKPFYDDPLIKQTYVNYSKITKKEFYEEHPNIKGFNEKIVDVNGGDGAGRSYNLVRSYTYSTMFGPLSVREEIYQNEEDFSLARTFPQVNYSGNRKGLIFEETFYTSRNITNRFIVPDFSFIYQ